MPKTTKQMAEWSHEFGQDYTARNLCEPNEMDTHIRNNIGHTRTELNHEFLFGLDRTIRILEVGANVGTQLMLLQNMGFTRLHGVELQHDAIEIARNRSQGIHFVQGTIFDIPYDDSEFDLVFTSGVLIHIHPDDIADAMREMHRCTRMFIWGYEYFSSEYEHVMYRGKQNLLWKADFARLYRSFFPDLTLVKERRYPYRHVDQLDSMFLLKKSSR